MPRLLPPRLEAVLGRPFDALSIPDLDRLVGLEETDDLEFKGERYGNRDKDRHELAADIAAFANARGGLIVLGMAADAQGRATSCAGASQMEGESRDGRACRGAGDLSAGVPQGV